jgi:transcriptional regulator with XRE-family HTH domain
LAEGLAISTSNPDPFDKHVGRRVRMRRMMLGMSQQKLGNAIGVTFQQVQKYEKGTNRMGSSRLMQIGQALEVPPTFFFEDALGKRKPNNNAPSPAYISDFLATSDGLALARSFTKLSGAKLRRAIVAMVEDVADN